MLKKLITYLLLTLTIFTNSWSFVSAQNHTYKEPKDGSGRSYDVKNVKNGESTQNSGDLEKELEKLLNDLLKEFGVSGVKINSRTGCTIDTQNDCLEEDYTKAQQILNNKALEKILPRIDVKLQKVFTKYNASFIKRLRYFLQTRYNNETGMKKLLVDYIILSISLHISNEAYLEGVRDTLSLNNFYDIAIQIAAGYGAGTVGKLLIKKIAEKGGKKVAAKLSAKAIPFVGWGLTGYAVLTAGTENIEYLNYCNELTTPPSGKEASYYCGVLTVNGIFIAGGLGVSHKNPKGWFKKMKLKNVKFSKKAQERMTQSGRFIPREFLKEVILKGKKMSDPQGSSANMYYYKMWKNGKEYKIEVLYDEKTNTIWHFMYTNIK